MKCECGHRGEYQFSMNTPRGSYPKCPDCGDQLEKVITAPGISGVKAHNSASASGHMLRDISSGREYPASELEFKGITLVVDSEKREAHIIPAVALKSDVQRVNKQVARYCPN